MIRFAFVPRTEPKSHAPVAQGFRQGVGQLPSSFKAGLAHLPVLHEDGGCAHIHQGRSRDEVLSHTRQGGHGGHEVLNIRGIRKDVRDEQLRDLEVMDNRKIAEHGGVAEEEWALRVCRETPGKGMKRIREELRSNQAIDEAKVDLRGQGAHLGR